jgi:hypothetical protein
MSPLFENESLLVQIQPSPPLKNNRTDSMEWETIEINYVQADDPGNNNGLSSNIERSKVPGGWLVRTILTGWSDIIYEVGDLTFVPDALYRWKIKDAD